MTDGMPAGGPIADPPAGPEGGTPIPPTEAGPVPDAAADPSACAACRRPLRPGAAFCGYCGHRLGDSPPASLPRPRESFSAIQRRVARDWSEVAFVIKFYVAMLAIQIVTAVVVKSGAEAFTAYLVADLLLAAATGVAAAMHWPEVRGLLVRSGFTPFLLAVVLGAALPVYAAVHAFVSGLQAAFQVRPDRILDDFAGRGFWWPVLLVCVSAAVFEELAFRGVIFGLLRRHARLMETLLVTATAFAILHLSAFALVSHTLLGLYLGWLRHRSGSLYPCVLAHFLHNALALADEQWGLLGW